MSTIEQSHDRQQLEDNERALAEMTTDALKIFRAGAHAAAMDNVITKSFKFDAPSYSFKIQTDTRLANQPDREHKLHNKVFHIFGAGKSAIHGACGIARAWRSVNYLHVFGRGFIVIPGEMQAWWQEQTERRRILDEVNVKVVSAGFNDVPDLNSYVASEAMFRYANHACSSEANCANPKGLNPIFFFVFDDFADTCLVNPNYISLEKKIDLIQNLKNQATKKEIRKVRNVFSKLWYGNLAFECMLRCCDDFDAIIGFYLDEDGYSDHSEGIGGSPTYLPRGDWNDAVAEAKEVLKRYKLDFEATLPYYNITDSTDYKVTNYVISCGQEFIPAAGEMCSKCNYTMELSLVNCDLCPAKLIEQLLTEVSKNSHIPGRKAYIIVSKCAKFGNSQTVAQDVAHQYIELASREKYLYPPNAIDTFMAISKWHSGRHPGVAGYVSSLYKRTNLDPKVSEFGILARNESSSKSSTWNKCELSELVNFDTFGFFANNVYILLIDVKG